MSSDVSLYGGTKFNLGRISASSMAYSNSLYYFHNDVESFSADLNSRFGQKASNQLLFTHTFQDDSRGTPSSNFPFIDILYDGAYEPYISAGYELFSYNNGVKTKTTNITDNFTLYMGSHKLTAGARKSLYWDSRLENSQEDVIRSAIDHTPPVSHCPARGSVSPAPDGYPEDS